MLFHCCFVLFWFCWCSWNFCQGVHMNSLKSERISRPPQSYHSSQQAWLPPFLDPILNSLFYDRLSASFFRRCVCSSLSAVPISLLLSSQCSYTIHVTTAVSSVILLWFVNCSSHDCSMMSSPLQLCQCLLVSLLSFLCTYCNGSLVCEHCLGTPK